MHELDSIEGSMLHYSAATRHLHILVAELACLMGPVVEAEYDRPLPAPEGLVALAAECAAVNTRFAPAGSLLWPLVPSSAYALFLLGEPQAILFILIWDASPSGWAALLRWWDAYGPLQEQLLAGTWPAGWNVSQQPYREALGCALALEAALQAVDHCSSVRILLNNAC